MVRWTGALRLLAGVGVGCGSEAGGPLGLVPCGVAAGVWFLVCTWGRAAAAGRAGGAARPGRGGWLRLGEAGGGFRYVAEVGSEGAKGGRREG